MSGQQLATDGSAGGPRVRVLDDAPRALDGEERSWLDAIEQGEQLDGAFVLAWRDDVLELRPPGEHDRRGIRAVFPPDTASGSTGAAVKRNPLLRSIGPRIARVIDVTGGLGGDACRIATGGWPVDVFERDPVVFALFASGWRAAGRSGAVPQAAWQRLRLERGDGREAIASLDEADVAVYLDPMYPLPRRASAKPRRELQVLRAWLGTDRDSAGSEEAAELVALARPRAARVVVKRPHHAPPLVEGPSFEIASKLVRFDVYANPERMSPARPTAGSEAGAG